MPGFHEVELRAGLGWVDPISGAIGIPKRGDVFQIAPGAGPTAIPFHVADVPSPVALIAAFYRSGKDSAANDRAAARLLEAGFAAVVWLIGEGPGAVLAEACLGAKSEDEEVGRALWTLKALGGWDETPSMTFVLGEACVPEGKVARSTWLSARGKRAGGRWIAEAWGLTLRAARVAAERDEAAGKRGVAMVTADVDEMKWFNDRHGFVVGDLLIARIHGCLEHLASTRGARFLRLGGDEYAILVETETDLSELAHATRSAVAALAIPADDPRRPGGLVAISTGTVPFRGGPSGDDWATRVRAGEDEMGARKLSRR